MNIGTLGKFQTTRPRMMKTTDVIRLNHPARLNNAFPSVIIMARNAIAGRLIPAATNITSM